MSSVTEKDFSRQSSLYGLKVGGVGVMDILAYRYSVEHDENGGNRQAIHVLPDLQWGLPFEWFENRIERDATLVR